MISCVIGAKERQDTATVDVFGAFLQTYMEGEVIIELNRQMTRQLVSINPIYAKDTTIKKKK